MVEFPPRRNSLELRAKLWAIIRGRACAHKVFDFYLHVKANIGSLWAAGSRHLCLCGLNAYGQVMMELLAGKDSTEALLLNLRIIFFCRIEDSGCEGDRLAFLHESAPEAILAGVTPNCDRSGHVVVPQHWALFINFGSKHIHPFSWLCDICDVPVSLVFIQQPLQIHFHSNRGTARSALHGGTHGSNSKWTTPSTDSTAPEAPSISHSDRSL
ncbi:hypothetical protein GOODEAATRI_021727 [Goodea atripinnis]|uniref:Uncharacterized protein n=1 Tax=Goodea atripinnis TaxID=208336 RepID=A0ABV0P6U3_9TELE